MLRLAGMTAAGAALAPALTPTPAEAAKGKFKISLAQWSLHKTLFGKQLDNLDFPKAAREQFGIEAVEYVNQFFKDKARDEAYLKELKKRCKDYGVKSVLIMCDGEGELGDADAAKRSQAVDNHIKWIDAAKLLGCHAIRVNAAGKGTPEEVSDRVAESATRLAEYGAKSKIAVIVENHGGLSSNADWLVGVMKKVNSPYFGTLPDFGNFYDYDRYEGVKKMMPYAHGVSAKSHEFDAQGNEVKTDYERMMQIVFDAGYKGYVGIEYEGSKHSEAEGILLTKKLLERFQS